jgi:O-antigen ligase
MARLEERPRRRPERRLRRLPPGTRLALVIFATLAILGPLAFGAVDRITQIALLALFAVGLFLRPPVVNPLTVWGNRLAITLLGVLIVKEFAPAAWFGSTHWRDVLTGNFNLELPWTHNPEPARALDGLLAWLAAAMWFAWVRTLASDRDCRPVLAWSLVASGALVTLVAFVTRGLDTQAIYGLRYTPGWTGFGPFPNRNHTGDLLAMSTILGCGAAAWNGVRQRWPGLIAGIVLTLISLVGLFTTQSRGALLAAGFGGAVFAGLVFVKVRSPRLIAAVLSGLVALGAVSIIFGSDVLGRFHSKEGGEVSNLMRVEIWRDTLRMWRDAPLFGHGLRTFPQIIGLYQTVRLEDQIIVHPESSWLQWLAELGVVPLLLAGVGLALFLSRQVRAAFKSDRGFYLRAGAFGACAVLLFHAAIDVPAHRWGTLGFALAALALACPLHIDAHLPAGSRRSSLVALSIAVFWTLPFMCDWPSWSPLSVDRLVERASGEGGVSLDEMQKAAHAMPLDPQLHQAMGMRQVQIVGAIAPTLWQRHYGIAATLIPGSWQLLALQARSVAPVSPGLAIGYWQQALERCDLHREDVLGLGVRETLSYPSARLLWGNYVEAHPDLLPAYAQLLPDEQARYFYSLWWQIRALTADLTPSELDIYYRYAARWGTRSQFDDWMRERAAWKDRDFRLWAVLLQQWNDFQPAFALLAAHVPEPAFPKDPPGAPRTQLEMKWRVTPKDVVNAQQLALLRQLEGATKESEAIILAVAARDYAPPWFIARAAYIQARAEHYAEAVALLLRATAPR